MLYSDEIYIEDFKRTYTEAYRKGFIDGFNERGYLLTYIGNDHIVAEQTEPSTGAITGLPGPCIGCEEHICEGCDFQKAKEAWRKSQTDYSWK